jgi:hypothetical protein
MLTAITTKQHFNQRTLFVLTFSGADALDVDFLLSQLVAQGDDEELLVAESLGRLYIPAVVVDGNSIGILVIGFLLQHE